MLFSATMPGPIVALARRFMNRPIHIRATDPDEGLTQANIKHVVYRAHSLDKDEVISRILQAEGRGKTVVFTRTKRAAAKLVEELNDRGFNAAAVHGDLNQEQRERAMAAFKAGKKDILIATDVAARGIDVNDVTHVINHTIPDDHDTYLHRAGRTGRAGKTGIAVTFVDWDDMHKWSLINKRARHGPAGAGRDLLVVTAPLQRPRHPGRLEGSAQAEPRAQGRGRRIPPAARAARAGTASARARAAPGTRRSTGERAHEAGAPGAGTHDGAAPARRRNRTRRRPSGDASTPPAAS